MSEPTFQNAFAGALMDAEQPVPAALIAHNGQAPQRRFAVYRNNVIVGLVSALRKRFPAIEKIVGEDFFGGMAGVFVRAHPPTSPLLMNYGESFPNFLETFAPVAELPYLADVARLECARTRAYHAPDAAPLAAADWQSADTNALFAARVTLHPSVQILRSAHPIVTIWAMNSGEAPLQPITDWCAEDAVVARPHQVVEVRRLPPGGAIFLQRLTDGASLAETAMMASEVHGFDLSNHLAGLIGGGLAMTLHLPSGEDIKE